MSANATYRCLLICRVAENLPESLLIMWVLYLHLFDLWYTGSERVKMIHPHLLAMKKSCKHLWVIATDVSLPLLCHRHWWVITIWWFVDTDESTTLMSHQHWWVINADESSTLISHQHWWVINTDESSVIHGWVIAIGESSTLMNHHHWWLRVSHRHVWVTDFHYCESST